MIIKLGRDQNPKNFGADQCLECGIKKLDLTQTFCSCCSGMLLVMMKREWFVKAHEEWISNELNNEDFELR